MKIEELDRITGLTGVLPQRAQSLIRFLSRRSPRHPPPSAGFGPAFGVSSGERSGYGSGGVGEDNAVNGVGWFVWLGVPGSQPPVWTPGRSVRMPDRPDKRRTSHQPPVTNHQ